MCWSFSGGVAIRYVRKVAHTRLPSVGSRSWSRFLKRAATNFAAWWTEARWVWTLCLRLLSDSVAAAIWVQHANHSAIEPTKHATYFPLISPFSIMVPMEQVMQVGCKLKVTYQRAVQVSHRRVYSNWFTRGQHSTGAESAIYDDLVYLAPHHLSMRTVEIRTILRCEHVVNGVTKNIVNISKLQNWNEYCLCLHLTLTRVFTQTEPRLSSLFAQSIMFHFFPRHPVNVKNLWIKL